ncbi:MAG: SusC/RagA family TonB-linked outer membrane protein, partial [Pedobacter sp.]
MKKCYANFLSGVSYVSKLCHVRTLSVLMAILLLATTAAWAQNIQITGTVRDAEGGIIPGVGIKVKDGTATAQTDVNGNFTITAPGKQAVLVFSFVGFDTYETTVGDRTTINVVLKDGQQDLSEVVVVGYGTQKKVNLSGAVSQITSKEITNRPVSNLTSALQGVSPGVTITRGSGKPGAEGTGIRIRGATSANTTDALILVDGIQMDMNLVNPDDVESISVLKDASAAAIYGARAAGGVVLVTTKKGSGGKAKVNFNSYYGLNVTARQPERLPSWEEQVLIDEARFNALGTREYTPEMMEWIKNPNFQYRENPGADRWEYFGSTDWVKEGMDRVNGMQNYSLSVSGGDQKLNYLASGGYYQRDGVLRYGPDDNSRRNLKLNVNAELNKYLTLGFIGGYVGSFVNENSNGTDNIIANLYRSRNRQVIYTPVEDVTGQPYNGDLQVNAINIQKNAGLETRNYETFQGRLNLNVKKLVKGLSADFTAWRNQDIYNMEANRRTLIWYGRSTALERFSINKPNTMEMIKNRLEGETMVITWCQVDTKIGSLVVHLEEGRVFD